MSIRPLSPELQKKANQELSEVPDRVQDDLQYIQCWLQKQRHLKVRTENQWLLSFLRGCKFSLQRTKVKLDYFYTMRSLVPEFFEDRDPFSHDIQEILKAEAFLLLPKTEDPAGPRILVCRWEVCDIDKISFVNLIKVLFMSLDVLMNEDDNLVVAGLKLWTDYRNFPASYLLQMTPGAIKKTIFCLQSAYPLRIKGIYCTYIPSVFEVIFNMCKQFMSEKLISRMAVYRESSFNNLLKDVPKSILPKEYGGEGGSTADLAGELFSKSGPIKHQKILAQWKKKLESYREWFLEDERYRSDEQLRLGEPVTSADVFGMEGTFRKLVID